MPLAAGNLLLDAYQNHYAVPALSVHSLDMVEAVIEAADTSNSPVLLQIGQRAIRNGQMQSLADHIVKTAANYKIPVGIHLDHCRTYPQVVEALYAGFTSCMMDASALPFEDNVALTQKAVETCHAVGVPVEGELGAIGGVEDDISVADEEVVYTSVEAAVAFVERTQVDSLAVAIGSAHGMYKRTPKLDLQRLQHIYEQTDVPLVLHGGSGIPKEQIQASLKYGIAKINFDTELRLAFVSGLSEGSRQFPDDPFSMMQFARERLKEMVYEKISYCRLEEVTNGGALQRS